jgi:hypothetical protein
MKKTTSTTQPHKGSQLNLKRSTIQGLTPPDLGQVAGGKKPTSAEPDER